MKKNFTDAIAMNGFESTLLSCSSERGRWLIAPEGDYPSFCLYSVVTDRRRDITTLTGKFFRSFIGILILTTLSWVIGSQTQAQTLASLYELERGIRPVGMGGAFAGLADDESAIYYNPAGLSFLGRTGVQSLVEQRFGNATYGSFSIAGRYLGLGALFVTLPNIAQRDSTGQEKSTFNYSSYGFTLAVGSSLTELPFFSDYKALENLGVGASFKIYGVKTFDPGDGLTFALDASLLYCVILEEIDFVDEVRIGLTLENLGPPIQYTSGYSEQWSVGSRLGVGAKLLQRTLDLAFDVELDGTLHLGSEYRLSGPSLSELSISELGFRLGLLSGENLFAFNLGLGVRLTNGLIVDYALSLHRELPASHRLGASYRFEMRTLLCTFWRGQCEGATEVQTPSYKSK
jgi:hypothetical protein